MVILLPGTTSSTVVHTAASVGPYIFSSVPAHTLLKLSARLSVSVSPPAITSFRPTAASRKLSFPRHICSREAVICTNCAPVSRMRPASSQGSIISSSSAITTGFPMASGKRDSTIKISNIILAVQSTGPVTEAISIFILANRLDRLRCRSMTPFGLPVEPEVNRTWIRSSPFIPVSSQGAAVSSSEESRGRAVLPCIFTRFSLSHSTIDAPAVSRI